MDKAKIREIISRMTLEEKSSLCSGKDFWTTKEIARLGIPSIMMTDGPHGLRKQSAAADHVGLNASVPATCFPSGVGLAASWDRELIERMGRSAGAEAKAEQVSVLLGPAVNIKRSPLCGRNFEYLSEDPFLAGEMAKHHIKGVQSQGVGASIKHFAANNQEKSRMLTDVVVDERTLREIYLPAFETAVKESQPWTVMCAYNKLNGAYCSQNRWLLTEVLKEEWGHEGIVVTDWGACDDRVEGLRAGQELEMPGNGGINDKAIVEAVRSGALDEAILDSALERLLNVTFMAAENLSPAARFDADLHHAEARRIAGECMVLLKNDGILPLAGSGKIALIGAFARSPRYQGGGSSHIAPTCVDDAVEEIGKKFGGAAILTYAPGYDPRMPEPDAALIEEAKRVAGEADVAVLFIGLIDRYESEGFDRQHIRLPESHTALLAAVREAQKNIVVVLSNGSPVEMPWLGDARAVLESYLGGQAWGGAVADILSGDVNPSGKLAETFPLRLEDNPSYLDFPGQGRRVHYREGIFVGYRHYDALAIEPLFPFGFGLSYTSFEYSGLETDRDSISDADALKVSLRVRNTGNVSGKEIVQLYLGHPGSSIARPVKELKAFEKVFLQPGEEKTVVFTLSGRAFAFWDSDLRGWRVETGKIDIMAGASSRDIRLTKRISIASSKESAREFDLNSSVAELAAHPVGAQFAADIRGALFASFGHSDPDSVEALMIGAMVDEMPLRNIVRMSGGRFSPEKMDELIGLLNRKEG